MQTKKQKRQATGDYPVGYCRPPAAHRFRPGQSGNPSGQRKRGEGKTTADELKEIVSTKVTVRVGDEERKMSLLAANLFIHGTKGAKGDVRSTALFLSKVENMGLLEHEVAGVLATGVANKTRPSDVLLENVNPDLLSREEQVELSKLAADIDGAGDVFALNTGALERLRALINKGRGNVVHFPRQTPS
jgi:Family of unknown function (DUF5681)